jgi:hypothetical protein
MPVWGEISRTRPDRPLGPPSLAYNGFRVFSWGNGGRGVTLTTHPHLVPRSWKNRTILLLPLWAYVAPCRLKPYLTLPYNLPSYLNISSSIIIHCCHLADMNLWSTPLTSPPTYLGYLKSEHHFILNLSQQLRVQVRSARGAVYSETGHTGSQQAAGCRNCTGGEK